MNISKQSLSTGEKMKKTGLIVIAIMLSGMVSQAALIGHWDFEDGTVNNQGAAGSDFNGQKFFCVQALSQE